LEDFNPCAKKEKFEKSKRGKFLLGQMQTSFALFKEKRKI